MDTLTVVLIVALVALALSAILYFAGFRPKKITITWPFGTAELEREPAGTKKPKATLATTTDVSQKAEGGGVIQDSPIEAPANSGAHVAQEATDKGRIKGSGITLE